MKRVLLYLLASAATLNAAAAWEDDVSENTQITPTGLNYYENDVKTNADGVSFVFILGSGSPPSFRLQIVSPDGERLLPRGGQLVSQEANNSWFGMNQYVELDQNGDAFVGVQDWRRNIEGQKTSYFIYKYTAEGTKVLDGAPLNDGQGHNLSSGLSMCATDDGGVVCAFNYTVEEDDKDYVVAEKLDAQGRSLWRKQLLTADAFSNPIPYLTDAGDGRVMALTAVGGQIMMQIIGSDGTLEMPEPQAVFTGGLASAKTWEVLQVEELPGHKAVISLVDGSKQGRLMVINPDGTIGLDGSDKGILLNDMAGYVSDKPAVSYNPGDDTYTCAYKAFDGMNGYRCSMLAKKINGKDGTPVWDGAAEIVPLQEDYQYGYYVMRNAGEGRSALFYMRLSAANYNDVKAYWQIIEADGTAGEPTPFATSEANKQTLRVSEMVDGKFIAAWDEKRTDQLSLFMQDIEINGTTGIGAPDGTAGMKDRHENYYTPGGVKLDGPRKGLNIITDGGGKARKVIIR